MCGRDRRSGRFLEKCPDCGATLVGKNWYIDYRVNGHRKREVVGPEKRFAELVLAKRKIQIKEGQFFETKKEEVHTLSEIAEDFLRYSKNNKRSYTRDLTLVKNLRSFFSNRNIEEITPNLIERYKKKRLSDDGRKPATVNRELAALKCMFNWAIKNGKMTVNPMKKIKMLKENNTRLRFLSKEEAQALVNNCPPHLRRVVITALLTGMRRGEILGLKWSDVDMTRGIITLRNTKSGMIRYIPISSQLAKVLSECVDSSDGEYVFCSRNRRPYKKMDNFFQKVVERAGLKDFRFHDLRHTAASYMVMAGIDLVTVKEILGHSKLDMTLRYAHLSPLHKQDAMERLGEKVDSFWTVRDNGQKSAGNVKCENILNNEVKNNLWCGTQVVKGEVCKTFIRRFKSGPHLCLNYLAG